MLFDSDDFEEFEELTEEEKIEFSINLVLNKIANKNKKIKYFLDLAKKNEIKKNKEYKAKLVPPEAALRIKKERSEVKKLSFFLEREKHRKRRVRENARKRWKEFEGKNARKDFPFEIFVQWPHARKENKKRNIRRNG